MGAVLVRLCISPAKLAAGFRCRGESTLRKIASEETKLINRIIDAAAMGGALPFSENVEQIDLYGSINIIDETNVGSSQHQELFPVEAYFTDADGVNVHALLFVRNGRIYQLEIYKDDESAIIAMPTAEEWTVLDLRVRTSDHGV